MNLQWVRVRVPDRCNKFSQSGSDFKVHVAQDLSRNWSRKPSTKCVNWRNTNFATKLDHAIVNLQWELSQDSSCWWKIDWIRMHRKMIVTPIVLLCFTGTCTEPDPDVSFWLPIGARNPKRVSKVASFKGYQEQTFVSYKWKHQNLFSDHFVMWVKYGSRVHRIHLKKVASQK